MIKHARLEAEARLALAQAKKMARMQIEVERQRSKMCPIREIVGFPLDDRRYRISRYSLSDMNLGQLHVIVNGIYAQIENLNEELVELLLERDDLHMEQDSMLVDIEDLTRYYIINSCCSTFSEASKDEALQSGQTTLHSRQVKITTK
ncbi:schwannomin-interacting protein 1-like [Limulus polyphemus]|uniref:Schwannomin-interacting protein 1-like n=1 Tax=Limulus polyphemus TaxID=6850 RepID=A0ABM1T2E9_LIMPO|nr:schwannomin-interacting protein 1-like [Limulus polyphemus]